MELFYHLRLSAVTSMQCKIGGKQTLKGVGKNPRLAQAKSKNDKNISGLLNQIEAGKIGIHTFTNASAFTMTDVDTKIISIEFATSEDNHAQFFGQMIVDVAADALEQSAVASGTVEIPDSQSVDVGNCVASVTGQSMGASAAWDGTIEVEESVSRWSFGTGNEAGRIRAVGMKEATGWEIDELMKRSYLDTVSGKFVIGAFGASFDV